MTSVAERRADRVAFLLGAYEAVDGSQMRQANRNELGARLAMDEARALDAYLWCDERGYLARTDMGGGFGLSHGGIEAAEQLLDQGAAVPLALLTLSVDELRAVEAFLHEYRKLDGALGLSADDIADVDAQVATVEAQMKSPKPRRRVVRATLRELVDLLRGVGGNATFELLKKLLELTDVL